MNYMRKRLILFLAMMMAIGTVLAQTHSASGKVVDENNEPVIGASVMIKGTNKGTKTDLDGQFEVKGLRPNDRLEVSYIGMKTKTVVPKAAMKIVLESDNQILDEVMVVAYGEQKKSSFTGSAGVVDTKKLEQRQVTNVMDALQGNVAGL